MLCVLSGQNTRCCANLFEDFPFSHGSIYTLFFTAKIKRKTDFESEIVLQKSDAILVAINKRILKNSSKASWLANGKPCRCYYTCNHMIFMKWVISLNNMTVM